MNKLIFVILLISSVSYGQRVGSSGNGTVGSSHNFDQSIVYVKTNYTNSGSDTSAWYTIEPYRNVAFILQSTDSTATDVYFDAKNSSATNTNQYTTYGDSLKLADSVAGGANTGEIRNILIKTTTLNRLNSPANNQVRFRVAHRASGAGTTSGRVFRIWKITTN